MTLALSTRFRSTFASRCIAGGGIMLALILANAAAATAADKPQACVPRDALSLAERGRASTTPCVVGKRQLMLELGYYQNASLVGGTALAAYPLSHIRYGINDRLEVFVDPATAIAKSTLVRGGAYTWSRSGGGARFVVSNTRQNVLAATVRYTPQSDETASISTRERFDLGAIDRVAVSERTTLSAALGEITYTQSNTDGNQQSSLYGRLALSERLSSHITATGLIGRDARVARDANPQTKIGLTLQDALSHNTVADVEVGTALNPAGNTKAHYLGFGISFLK